MSGGSMKIKNHIVTQFGVGTSNYLGLDLEDSMVIISVSFFCEVVCISLIWNTTVFEQIYLYASLTQFRQQPSSCYELS